MILFIISGFFIGKGFFNGKYEYSISGILKFYIRRLLKVGVPTWIFIFITGTIVEPEFFYQNPNVISKILTFTYYNIPASNCIGATWYVSTLMQLYLLAPIICWIITMIVKKIRKHLTVKVCFLLILIIIIGLSYRRYLYLSGADWSSKVYVPFYSNLDLYSCGILLNFVKIPSVSGTQKKQFLNSVIKLSLVVLILVNCYIAYIADYNTDFLYCYQYILPSVYIIFVCTYLKVAEQCLLPQKPFNYRNMIKNPFRLFDIFAKVSFEFYLVHSLVIYKIYIYFAGDNLLYVHFKVILSSFIISIIFAFLLRNMFIFKSKATTC